MLVMNHGDVMLTDHSDLARRLHVADADVRAVYWVDGECYVTLVDGAVRLLHETGFEILDRMPVIVVNEMVPDGNVHIVLEWVGDDLDRAQQALDDELARARPRKGLLTHLERLTA